MDANAKKILDQLKKGKFEPIYVLQGEETFYIDLISNYIEENALSESERGFNQVIVYGKDSPTHSILTHARRFPMMAERQVVIVREAQDIPDLQKEVGAKLMLEYIANPVPTTILVLCHKHKTLDRRKELGKKIDKLVASFIFKKPYDSQLPAFINDYLTSKGFSIEDTGTRVLCEYIGTDLKRLSNEIDKLLIGLQPGTKVSGDMVMEQVGVSREYNIFELQKALVARDPLTANKIVNYFESNTRKNPLIPMVAFLYSFYSKLLIASGLQDKSERSLITNLKISPFAAKDYARALQSYSSTHLSKCVASIANTDLKLKGINSGSASEGQILKELVYQLLHA